MCVHRSKLSPLYVILLYMKTDKYVAISDVMMMYCTMRPLLGFPQEEAVRSGKQNAAVEMRWAELLDENMPQELHRNIEDQKAACTEIVASKVRMVHAIISDSRPIFTSSEVGSIQNRHFLQPRRLVSCDARYFFTCGGWYRCFRNNQLLFFFFLFTLVLYLKRTKNDLIKD